jgi:hypothetical protein
LNAFQKQGDPIIYNTNPSTEGTRYVSNIFKTLKVNFGYKDLDNQIDNNTNGFGLTA